MRRELISVRHALAVLVGAVLIWIANESALPLFTRLPGLAEQLSEWRMAYPQLSASGAVVWALVLAVAMTLTQEVRRFRGLGAAVGIGVAIGLFSFMSRAFSVPSHLYDVALVFGAVRAIGATAASVLMYLSKQPRNDPREAFASNAR